VLVHDELQASSLLNIVNKLQPLLPSFVVYGNSRFVTKPMHQASLIIGFDGFAEDVAVQANSVQQLLKAQHLQIITNKQDVSKLYETISSFTFNKPEALRIASLPSGISTIIPLLEQFPALIDLANGTADVISSSQNLSALSEIITANGLHGVYLWKNENAVLAGAVPEAEKKLAHRLKETFDPRGVFNPRGYYL
jgi:FAD/FMN-containing dehydrogenase